MIEFMSSWVKGLGLAIVIVSILEMLLPNNKTKKYIRMVMGIYVLFTIISPFINNQKILESSQLNLEDYTSTQTSTTLDQRSMDERIQDLYIQELEKDIVKKLKEKGYLVTSCKVKAKISDKEEETQITKIKVKVQKLLESENETQKQENLENKVVTEIQKIKPVNTTIKQEKNTQANETEEKKEEDKDTKVNRTDIQNIKKFLIEEYGVNEKCLEIN
ncbi:MAG: stage III sporulation protein AF [Clostridia bacterium]|nr:stage III sporulation protein AF [Clostridia bacterium]